MNIKAKSIFTLIILIITLFTLAACEGLTPIPTGDEKTVPVYQGMEISETLSTLSANNSIRTNIMRLSNIGVIRNLNTNPINQDDPFGTLDDGTIYEVISAEFPVTQTEVSDYYSEINKDIFITVKLINPDNFVILSFTLNGVFYQSYQFQDGSDSENLILKVNTGTVSGVKEYTIDAIKYIDGTEIKDAIFAGERTITVGLKHSSEPTVIVSNEVVNATSIMLTVNLSDSQSLSKLNKIVLYDGESLVQIYDLSLGENNIVFDKLNINTLYQYAVISVYDLIDGNNSTLSLLEKKALYTDDIVAIDNVVPTQTSVGFGVTVTDVDQVGAVSAIELYEGETLVEALSDLSVREFTGLLSNNEYTIKVTYTYDLNDGVGSQTLMINQAATTLAKATPVVVIDNVVPTQTSIGFGITVTDVDQVGLVSAIELYKGETSVEALTDLSVREITGLLSNNEHTIKVTYTYDLNDGVGSQTLTINQSAKTLANATPTIEIIDVMETQESISFELDITDVDQVGAVSEIELYQGETLIKELTDLNVREFTGLLSNTEYIIKVSYIYDLNDGQGDHNLKVRTYNYLTADKFIDSNQSEGYVWGLIHAKIDSNKSIYLINPLTGNLNINIKVYFEDITIEEFNTLGYGDKIIVYGTFINGYVLGDFKTVEKRDTIDDVKTKEKQTPTVVIDNVVPTQTSIGFGITVTDVDQVGAVSAIELYKGETLVEALTDLSIREFTGLLSNNEYIIKVTYIYDLIEGKGAVHYLSIHKIVTLVIDGSGTDENPYKITIAADFNFLREHPSSSYLLLNSIDLSGLEWEPIMHFQGKLNGNGYILNNLTISSSFSYAGLFASNSGVIENLGINNILINVNWLNAGDARIGGIAGQNSGTIKLSYVNGNISANTYNHLHLGGIVGYNTGSIMDCYSDANINSISSTIAYAGGISGWVHYGTIDNTYSSGEIYASATYQSIAGGVVGFNNFGVISDSFSIASVGVGNFGNSRAGGLVGENSGAIINSYRIVEQTINSNNVITLGIEINIDVINATWIEMTLLWDSSKWNLTDISDYRPLLN